MRKHSLLIVLGALSGLLISGCASLKIPDEYLCVEISHTRGYCTKVISDEEVIIDEEHKFSFDDGADTESWWEMRPSFILMPVETWEAYKKFLVMLCKKYKCTADISKWDRAVERLDSIGYSK